MRETIGSLRAYFIVVALYSAWNSRGMFTEFQLLLAQGMMGIIGIGICLASLALTLGYGYVGMNLEQLLKNSPAMVEGIIYSSMAVIGFQYLVAFLVLGTLGLIFGAPTFLIGMAISTYLLVNVRRLSKAK
jgi:hypothetical protein